MKTWEPRVEIARACVGEAGWMRKGGCGGGGVGRLGLCEGRLVEWAMEFFLMGLKEIS